MKRWTLTNINVDDQSLEPLSQLHVLETLEISNQFPLEEYAKLSVELSQTECKMFSPYIKLNSSIRENDMT